MGEIAAAAAVVVWLALLLVAALKSIGHGGGGLMPHLDPVAGVYHNGAHNKVSRGLYYRECK